MGLIHKSCLERWLAASDSNRCELCHFKFTIKRQPKSVLSLESNTRIIIILKYNMELPFCRYGILKAVKVWMLSEDSKSERLHVLLDIIRLTVSLPIIFFINHLTAVLFEIFHFEDIEACDLFSFLKNIESQLNVI